MNKLAKNLSLLAIASLGLLFLCLFFIEYEIFGNCLVSIQNNEQYVLVTEQDYTKLDNKSKLRIKLDEQLQSVTIIDGWTYDNQNKIWSAKFNGNSDLSSGNLKLYLKQVNLLGFN